MALPVLCEFLAHSRAQFASSEAGCQTCSSRSRQVNHHLHPAPRLSISRPAAARRPGHRCKGGRHPVALGRVETSRPGCVLMAWSGLSASKRAGCDTGLLCRACGVASRSNSGVTRSTWSTPRRSSPRSSGAPRIPGGVTSVTSEACPDGTRSTLASSGARPTKSRTTGTRAFCHWRKCSTDLGLSRRAGGRNGAGVATQTTCQSSSSPSCRL